MSTHLDVTAPEAVLAKAKPTFNWQLAMVIVGLGLTAAWVCFLSYGFVKLIQMVI